MASTHLTIKKHTRLRGKEPRTGENVALQNAKSHSMHGKMGLSRSMIATYATKTCKPPIVAGVGVANILKVVGWRSLSSINKTRTCEAIIGEARQRGNELSF